MMDPDGITQALREGSPRGQPPPMRDWYEGKRGPLLRSAPPTGCSLVAFTVLLRGSPAQYRQQNSRFIHIWRPF